MEVTMEDAYVEACKALGEAVVRERLLMAEIAKRDEAIRRLGEQLAGRSPMDCPPESA